MFMHDLHVYDISCMHMYTSDLQQRYLQPEAANAFLTVVEGACSKRPRDEALTLGPSSNPGIRINFNEIDNRLSGSSCIGLIANTDTNNVEPVAVFYDSSLIEIGRIVLTRSNINVTVRNSFASFSFPEQSILAHSRLQLCMDGVRMELYHDCVLVGSEPFVSDGFQGSDVIGLLRHLVMENVAPYLVSSKVTCIDYTPISFAHMQLCFQTPIHYSTSSPSIHRTVWHSSI